MKSLPDRFVSGGSCGLGILFSILFVSEFVHATSYYWDTNGASGFGSVNSTWNTSPYWNTSSSGATNGTFVSNPTASDDLYISAGTAGTLTLVGIKSAGSLTLSNNVDITLSGGTLALGGTTTNKGLFIAASDQSKTSIFSAITLNSSDTTIQTAGTKVLYLYGGITGAQNLILKNNSTHAGGISISSGSVNNTGTVTNSGSGTGGIIISSVIGTNVAGLTQNSVSSMLTLSGANTYTGATTISAGTLTLGADEVIPDNSAVTVNGRLQSGGYDETIGSLSGGGTIDNNNSGSKKHSSLTVGGNHASTNFSGTISSTGGNRMSITKVGTGTLTLGGNDTADDTLTINAGVVRINATAALTAGNITFDGGVLGLGVDNFTRSLGTGNGQVQFTGSGGFAAYTVDRTINIGGASAKLTWNSTHKFLTSDKILILGAADADRTVNFQNPIDFNGAARTVQVENGSAAVDAILSGVLSGCNGGITKTGAGTLTISNVNTYSGLTTVSAGTLALGVNNALSTGAVAVAGGTLNVATFTDTVGGVTLSSGSITGTTGTLTGAYFNLTDSGTVSAILSGTGPLTKTGAGTVTLSGGNTYGGGTTVTNGTLSIGNNTALGTGTVTLGATSGSNNAAIMFNAAGLSLRTNITVRDTTSGILTIGGTNTSGTSSYDSSITLGSTTNTGKSLTVSAAADGTVTFNGNILKNGTNTTAAVSAVNSTGSGNATIVLGGNNTYAGGTTINPNVTLVSPATNASINTLGTGTVTLLGGTLALQGKTSFGQAVNRAASGWNSDVILANSPKDVSTLTPAWGGTVSFDTGSTSTGTAYIENGYGGTGNIGLTTTAFTSRISNTVVGKSGDVMKTSFQLQPFTTANALMLNSANPSRTLSLTTPTAFHDISILASSAGITDRNPTPTVTLNFSDGSSVSTTIIAYDWYLLTAGQEATRNPYQALPNRVKRWNLAASPSVGTLDSGGGANFGMYETDIDLSNINGVNYSGKTLTSLTFHNDVTQAANSYEAIFAVSGAVNTLNPTQTYANNVVVTSDSSINVSGSLAATMGTLGIGANRLSVTSADATASPYSLTLAASSLSGNPTFDVANSTGGGAGTLVLGALNDGGTARTITKQGAGSLTLDSAATSLVGGTVLNITGGTVNSNQATALGNLAAVSVSGGATFNAGASQTIGSLNGAGSATLGANTLTVGSSNNLSSIFSGAISGSGGSLVKATTGTLTLTGTNTYSGATTVSGGKLVVGSTGTINSTSGVTIGTASTAATVEFNYNSTTALSKPVSFAWASTGGILSGTGTITPGFTVTSGNTYTPGTVQAQGGGSAGVGTQTLSGAVTFNSGSIFEWDLAGTTTDPGAGASNQGTYDKVVANGAVTGATMLTVVLGNTGYGNAFWDTNKSWTNIFTTTGGGTFNLSTLFSSFGGTDVQPSGIVPGQGYFSTSGNTLNWTAVPEPTSALVGVLLGVGLLRRRRS